MSIEDHPRYKRFTLSDVVRNDCAIHENNLSFIIFYNDYLLRGHAFHFIIPAEFSIGWCYYSTSFNPTDIKNSYKQMDKIKCPYVKMPYIEKNQCYGCSRGEPKRYEACSKILNKKILNEYVSSVSQMLQNVLKKPRFSKTLQNRTGKRAKMLIGLCDNKIVVKCKLMNDDITYNVVTAHVPDAEKHGNNLSYMIGTVRQEIESRHINGWPLLCNDNNWWV